MGYKHTETEGTWFFISFVDPKTRRNIGCCNVSVKGTGLDALEKAGQLGINPGGQAMMIEIEEPELEPDRLYSR